MAERSDIRQRVANLMMAGINAAAIGVTCTNAVNYKPPTIARAELPLVFTQNGRGQYDWTQHGFENLTEALRLELVVVVRALTSGTRGVAESEADQYTKIAQDYLGARRRFSLVAEDDDSAVLEMLITGDKGLRVIRWDTTSYFCAIIDLVIAHERIIGYKGL